MSIAVQLREVVDGDLPIFFEQQLDSVANQMAAFTRERPSDKEAFASHWDRIRTDDTVSVRTIVWGGHVAGHIAKFERFGDPEVTYWIGREYWGKGVATEALSQFLGAIDVRPLFARAARDNLASLRVLEKCGFVVSSYARGFANARGEEIEEAVLKLE